MKKIIKLNLILAFFFLSSAIIAQFNFVKMKDTKENNLKVEMDINKGTVNRIYNLNTKISDYKYDINNLSVMAIEKLSKDIFNDYEHILNIESSSFKMKTAETASGMWFVSYEQIKNDVPIYNSELGYTINKNGNLVSLGGNYYKDVDVSTTPSISSATAIEAAKKSFEITECTEKEETELVILPKETNDSMEFYLTWKIFLASQKPHKQEIIFVNAENGQIIESINNFRE